MKKQLLTLLAIMSMLVTSCKEDDPAPADETELITTVELHFTETSGGSHSIITFKDPDGAGGNAPITFDNISLKKGTSYNLMVYLKNESNPTNPIDITQEVKAESADHQFFYVFSPTSLGSSVYLDKDTNQKPLGIENNITTAASAGSGKLTVILRHKPDKDASGVASGNPANAGGETDVEVAFNLTTI